MAWMRMMGAESVAYHKESIVERADDYPGLALAYYGSRGETPLVWGGSGAERLDLTGAVGDAGYEAVFGPGGARHPVSGIRLVNAKRPGMELVIAAHKSVAELGVIGRPDDMHKIMDAERDATLGYLDGVMKTGGGRRGRAETMTRTAGLTYVHTRHATSRSGDPAPHDHVLIANLVWMLDEEGGWKAATMTLLRDHLHAATMVGRVAAARKAVELGYGIEADNGPSGRLRHWRISGVPDEVITVHSKRAREIQEEVDRRGTTSYRARGVAARSTRDRKRHAGADELMARWRRELAELGWPVERIDNEVRRAGLETRIGRVDVRQVVAEVLGEDGTLAREKIFARKEVIVEVAPHLFGQDPNLLDRVVDRAIADPETVPLLRVPGAREAVYSLASVLSRETAIATGVERLAGRSDRAKVDPGGVLRAVESEMGRPLTEGQRQAVNAICQSGRGAEIVMGVAGSGKTTMLAAVAAAFEAAGCQVVGTATSGQAALNLASEAEIDTSRTVASLMWHIDNGRLTLNSRTVLILDEAGMTDDPDCHRLVSAAERTGAKLVMVGDDRQLGPVGPGGAMGALVARHPEVLHRLGENLRQRDPGERAALEELRAGSVAAAVDWYQRRGRICVRPDRDTAIERTVEGWATDVDAGRDTAMYAYLRGDVAALNAGARDWMTQTGRLSGPELGGFRAGDRVVATAPVPGLLVTSERATVTAVDPQQAHVELETRDGRTVRLDAEHLGRLNYGYATTVHRSQGVTVDRAHVYADGGGRELAYVAMSRARETSRVYVVADDTPMAVEDLTRDWNKERRPTWAIDTGLPATGDLTPEKVAAMTAETRGHVVAIALGETAGSADPRRATLERQLAIYRDRLEGVTHQQRQVMGMDI